MNTVAGGGTNAAGTSLGSGYFGGFDTSTIKREEPSWWRQYPAAAVSAYLRGGATSRPCP